MAEAEISDYAAEAETLAERVDWARGGELTAALEQLEAVSAAAPAEAGPHATSVLVSLLAKNDCGPEAAQRAVETLSRLADSTKHGAAATKNGALFLSDPKNVVVILDVLEEEQQEKSTMDDGAEEAARGAIKLNAAERKAAEAARVEHQRYLEQLEKQLELEERDCRQALKPIAGRDECI